MLVLCGCDLGRMGASMTIAIAQRSIPGFESLRDPELVEETLPGGIAFLEGLVEVAPDNLRARTILAGAYGAYAFGFLVEKMEQAEHDGEPEERIAYWRSRASLALYRARELGIDGCDQVRGGPGALMAARNQGIEAFRRYIGSIDDREHAELLFWTAYAWANWMAVNLDDMNAVADLPFVVALAERVVELDSSVYHHAPIALRAAIWGAVPGVFGGRPDEARAELERLIELTERHNLTYLVLMARIVAPAFQDREMFRSLLQEVLDADTDAHAEIRMQNILAQRRARRYLEEMDNFFF